MGGVQNTSSAVMAQRARGEVVGDTADQKLWRALEFFPTPPWAARAGAELVLRLDPGVERWVWEPACGMGHMAGPLREYFSPVLATDIHDHGWDEMNGYPLDFLSPAADAFDQADWIITNPPFETAADFVRLGLKRARRGVAVLCRMQFLESAGRHDLFYGAEPLTVLAPFAERVPMQLGVWDPKGSTATGYAWFVWMKPEALVNAAVHHPAITATTPVIWPIGPGSKARLTRPDDARRYGLRAEAPLLDRMVGA